NGTPIDLTPRMLPDVYAGHPLVLLGQADRLSGTMTVSGRTGTRRWSQTLDLANAIDSPAVAKLWARRKVSDVETERTLGKLDGEAADRAIGMLGLAY